MVLLFDDLYKLFLGTLIKRRSEVLTTWKKAFTWNMVLSYTGTEERLKQIVKYFISKNFK